MKIVVAVKWVDTRPEVDGLTGVVTNDDRTRGMSAADSAALEWALQLREAAGGTVTVVTVGPDGAEAMLRDAISAGADDAVHLVADHELDSNQVARALRTATDAADLVCCGDWSLDRGSGMVPGLIAAEHGRGQALGLTMVEIPAPGAPMGTIDVERRLDGGWRERLRVTLPAVISVEGGSATLRRAPLPSVIAAREATIERRALPDVGPDQQLVTGRSPYRPRTRVKPAPAATSSRERILELTGATVDRTPPQTVVADPSEAARLIHEQLRSWGHVD